METSIWCTPKFTVILLAKIYDLQHASNFNKFKLMKHTVF